MPTVLSTAPETRVRPAPPRPRRPAANPASASSAPRPERARPVAAPAGSGLHFEDPRIREVLRDTAGDVLPRLRDAITGALHHGTLREGDRLPSVRKTAEAFGVTAYAALQAYVALEAEGLVERRERSGVYVGCMERQPARALPETGTWLAQVLTEACEHQLKIPRLPELIQQWTAALAVRCTCIESCVDLRVALCLELEQQFGMQPTPREPESEASARKGAPEETDRSIRDADLLVTTPYHAAEARRLADEHGKPLLLATLNPATVAAAEQRLRGGGLTVICVDPLFGERIRRLHGGIHRKRVRVVLAHDARSLRALDRAEPVLLTPAARQAMDPCDFRLIAPVRPSFSLEFARKTAEMLIRLNLRAARA